MGKGGKTVHDSVRGETSLDVSRMTIVQGGIVDNGTTVTTKSFKRTTGSTIPGQTGFFWSPDDEPHCARRAKILTKYPEIKKLYGYDPLMRYQVIAVVILQISLSLYVRDQPWWKFIIIAYVIGGTCNHMMLMALHELSHNLGFKHPAHNKYFAMFVANLPVVFPAAVTFKKYHMEHHRYQGVDVLDVDIPTDFEGRIFNNVFTKMLFVVFQMAAYTIRPAFVNPKIPGQLEFLNAVGVFSFDIALTYFSGSIYPLLYLLLSTFLGFGMHPCAGHFIAEHYVFGTNHVNGTNATELIPEAETYSYYGPVNIFNFNVGYHNEHHDFPFVPGRRLPQVRKIAPEFYEQLPSHTSYFMVLYDYVTNTSVTGFSRVKRTTTSALGGAEPLEVSTTKKEL